MKPTKTQQGYLKLDPRAAKTIALRLKLYRDQLERLAQHGQLAAIAEGIEGINLRLDSPWLTAIDLSLDRQIKHLDRVLNLLASADEAREEGTVEAVEEENN